jgi:hypothetical protein
MVKACCPHLYNKLTGWLGLASCLFLTWVPFLSGSHWHLTNGLPPHPSPPWNTTHKGHWWPSVIESIVFSDFVSPHLSVTTGPASHMTCPALHWDPAWPGIHDQALESDCLRLSPSWMFSSYLTRGQLPGLLCFCLLLYKIVIITLLTSQRPVRIEWNYARKHLRTMPGTEGEPYRLVISTEPHWIMPGTLPSFSWLWLRSCPKQVILFWVEPLHWLSPSLEVTSYEY